MQIDEVLDSATDVLSYEKYNVGDISTLKIDTGSKILLLIAIIAVPICIVISTI